VPLRFPIACLLIAACGPSAPVPDATVGAGSEAPHAARFALRGRWPDLSVETPLTWGLEPEGSPIARADFEEAVRSALEEWQTTDLVAFRPAVAGEPADLVLGWRQGAHGDRCLPFGIDTSIAHTGPVGPGTFIHFDLERDWSGGEDGHDLASAALHEIGHALGLDHTPDASAVMYPEPLGVRRHLARSDRLGLRTLYADPAAALEPGSLRVFLEGAPDPCAALRGIAPGGAGTWTLFDADGDGRDELLCWDPGTDEELWAIHFDGQGRPERTVGPLLGVAVPEATLRFGRDPDGTRLVVVAFGERRHGVVLDDRGRPLGVRDGVPAPEDLEPFPRVTGSVTGDGRSATVRP
jgi:hypothetical protein